MNSRLRPLALLRERGNDIETLLIRESVRWWQGVLGTILTLLLIQSGKLKGLGDL